LNTALKKYQHPVMRVLSLFDGISCARVALTQAGVRVGVYYASEVDSKAIQIAMKNYPDTIQLGDIRELRTPPNSIDLLIGGSPCQDLSIAKQNREGLQGSRSSLFWEYIRIFRIVKPRWFILENVASMSEEDRDIITAEMGVEPVMFNASLVSAQSRKRLFWTNIPFTLPPDRGILLKDILQPDAEVDESMVTKGKSFCLTATYHNGGEGQWEYENNKKKHQRTMVKLGHLSNTDSQGNRVYSPEGKSVTLGALGGGGGAKTGLYEVQDRIRKLTPIECERLQGLPDNYTEGIAKTHRYKCLGNGFCVPVIAHILGNLRP
jgi:DNA (cytosine-5)-methyltransferase 3A